MHCWILCKGCEFSRQIGRLSKVEKLFFEANAFVQFRTSKMTKGSIKQSLVYVVRLCYIILCRLYMLLLERISSPYEWCRRVKMRRLFHILRVLVWRRLYLISPLRTLRRPKADRYSLAMEAYKKRGQNSKALNFLSELAYNDFGFCRCNTQTWKWLLNQISDMSMVTYSV